MKALRTFLATVAAAVLAAGCATTPADTAALAASIESIGHWSAGAPPARPGAAVADADKSALPVVSQAARR
jgi:hypothetical protein